MIRAKPIVSCQGWQGRPEIVDLESQNKDFWRVLKFRPMWAVIELSRRVPTCGPVANCDGAFEKKSSLGKEREGRVAEMRIYS
jgi:hypothetical protein